MVVSIKYDSRRSNVRKESPDTDIHLISIIQSISNAMWHLIFHSSQHTTSALSWLANNNTNTLVPLMSAENRDVGCKVHKRETPKKVKD